MDSVIDGRDSDTEKNPTKDPTYFFYNDFIVLKVEDTLFRLHLFQLSKHSQYFRELFKPPQFAAETTQGNPFIVSGITVEELHHFLRIILPSMSENLETVWTNETDVSRDEWLSVLKISTLWRCRFLRELAIRQVESESVEEALNAMEKILLGRQYSISRWVWAGYTTIATTGKITDVDMEAIGAVESFKLMRISRENLSRPRSITVSLEDTVQKTFQAELESITTAETALYYGEESAEFNAWGVQYCQSP